MARCSCRGSPAWKCGVSTNGLRAARAAIQAPTHAGRGAQCAWTAAALRASRRTRPAQLRRVPPGEGLETEPRQQTRDGVAGRREGAAPYNEDAGLHVLGSDGDRAMEARRSPLQWSPPELVVRDRAQGEHAHQRGVARLPARHPRAPRLGAPDRGRVARHDVQYLHATNIPAMCRASRLPSDASLDAPAARGAGAQGQAARSGRGSLASEASPSPARSHPALRARPGPERDVPRDLECGLRLLVAPAADEDRQAKACSGGIADPHPVRARHARGGERFSLQQGEVRLGPPGASAQASVEAAPASRREPTRPPSMRRRHHRAASRDDARGAVGDMNREPGSRKGDGSPPTEAAFKCGVLQPAPGAVLVRSSCLGGGPERRHRCG